MSDAAEMPWWHTSGGPEVDKLKAKIGLETERASRLEFELARERYRVAEVERGQLALAEAVREACLEFVCGNPECPDSICEGKRMRALDLPSIIARVRGGG